jgi:hypothetical protein
MSRVSLKMNKIWSLVGLAGLLGLSGCAMNPDTRLPSLGWNDARAERVAAEYHDPLPEADVGPNTSARPRGFTTARSEPRRTLEGASRVRYPNTLGYRPSSTYPAVVQP